MRQVRLELGELVEHASEDQAGGRHGGLGDVPHQVRQVVFPEPVEAELRRNGMDEHRYVEFLDLPEERPELRLVEVAAAHVGADRDAAHAELLHGALDLRRRALRLAQRRDGERDEAVRVARQRLGHGVVERARRL